MEKYTKPEMTVIDMKKDDAILTSGGSCDVIVSWRVEYSDGAGNQYSVSGN